MWYYSSPYPSHSPKTQVEKQADGSFLVTTEDGKTATASQVMYATGRKANTDNLGLETAGVAVNPNGGAIIVDDSSKTNVPSIWAVGDVTNRINLTPVALHEGHCFADTEFGKKPRNPCHDLVAAAVFSQPPIGTVGLTQEQAGKKYKKVAIYRSGFRPMMHTMTGVFHPPPACVYTRYPGCACTNAFQIDEPPKTLKKGNPHPTSYSQ